MWIRQILVAVVGLASGFAVAAGLFSFIIGLGVVSDFADRTHTGKHVMLYENCIMAGGILGNIFWVYGLAMPGGKWIVPVFGLFSGIFVGCWSMALAFADAAFTRKRAVRPALQGFTAVAAVWQILTSSTIPSMIHMK